MSFKHQLRFVLPLLTSSLVVSISSEAAPQTVHVYVALCDNDNQGIVPVPARLGNGTDPAHNLYWGAAFGVKTFFHRSSHWTLLKSISSPRDAILERIVLKHKTTETYLIADAYRGNAIKQAVLDFLSATAGRNPEVVSVELGGSAVTIMAGGSSPLLVYVGHNGLMDFTLSNPPSPANDKVRQAVILACASKPYFTDALRRTGASPLLWTTGLMAPEAYTLHSALEGWIAGETDLAVRKRAAEAYHQYQKCGINAAMRLFQTGW